MLENWDQNLGRKEGNHNHGGIFETRSREGQWKIISVKAKVEVIGLDKTSWRKERRKGRSEKTDPWRMDTFMGGNRGPWQSEQWVRSLSRRIKLVQYLGSQEEKPAARVSNAAMRWGCKKPWPHWFSRTLLGTSREPAEGLEQKPDPRNEGKAQGPAV